MSTNERCGGVVSGLAVGVVALAGVLGAVLGGCGVQRPTANASAVDAIADDRVLEGREVVLTVFGMSCPLCANNVDNTLKEVAGVERVAVDMGSGEVRVGLDGKTPVTRRQLAKAVDRSGFSLKKVEVRP
jgi:copper chaperone CopZ